MSSFDLLLCVLGVVALFILVRWLLRRHPRIAHFIFRFTAIILWSLAFTIGSWVALVLIQGVIIAHFQTLAALLTGVDSLSWILLCIMLVSGLSGFIFGCLGKLPGTKLFQSSDRDV
jgi:hypothetical protein